MFIKKVLGKNYINYLQSLLYSNCNKKVIKDKIDKDLFLFTIANLIIRRKNIQAVVTYNYDNFLSETLKILEPDTSMLKTVDIFGSVQKLKHNNRVLPIYHVHGFIPPPDNPIIYDIENIVLSTDEYFNNMIEPFSWQTTTQLFYLNNYNCLFLGTSLNDWNMLRVLSYSNHFSKASKHFVIFRNEFYRNPIRIANFMNRIKASTFEGIGIKPIYTTTDDYKEIYEKLDKL